MSYLTESHLSNYRIRTKTFSKDNIVALIMIMMYLEFNKFVILDRWKKISQYPE